MRRGQRATHVDGDVGRADGFSRRTEVTNQRSAAVEGDAEIARGLKFGAAQLGRGGGKLPGINRAFLTKSIEHDEFRTIAAPAVGRSDTDFVTPRIESRRTQAIRLIRARAVGRDCQAGNSITIHFDENGFGGGVLRVRLEIAADVLVLKRVESAPARSDCSRRNADAVRGLFHEARASACGTAPKPADQ